MSFDMGKALYDESEEPMPTDISETIPMSLEIVKPQFKAYVELVSSMANEADLLQVTSDERMTDAVELGGGAKRLIKTIEAKREEVTAEARQFVSSVNSFCKIFTEKLKGSTVVLERKITQYRTQQELERRKQEEQARKATEEFQKKLDAEAKAAGVEAPIAVAPVIPEAKPTVKTETGVTAYGRKKWKAEIEDEAAVPREYCSSDMKKINAAVKAGVRSIPGVKIFEDTKTVFRT